MDQTENIKQKYIAQCLAMANNYICTGRNNKAVEMLSAVNQISPGNELARQLMHRIYCLQINEAPVDFSNQFGLHWLGEDITGKSIEIFCDQGMGDTINLLRYVEQLKEKYDCYIILNYYAFWNQFIMPLTLKN